MKVGIVGAGKMGQALAALFAKAGHEVCLSNSRGPDSVSYTHLDVYKRQEGILVAAASKRVAKRKSKPDVTAGTEGSTSGTAPLSARARHGVRA